MKHTPGPWKAFISGKVIEVRPVKGKPVVAWPGFDESDIPLATHKANARLIAAAPGLLAACEILWFELKNKLASIDVHPGFPFDDASPCTVYFLDRIVHCGTMTEGIAKCEELMAEEFPDVYAAIAAAKGPPQ